MVPEATLERFHASLQRCLSDQGFLARFYERFVSAHPGVATRFRHTDMKRQEDVLRTSLYLVLRAAQGGDDGHAHLREVARTHSQRGYDITPDLYQVWLDTLVGLAAESDPQWSADVAESWSRCVVPFIEGMQAAYVDAT